MKVEIIAIGNEVLSGYTINTNAAFIARQLLNIGIHTAKCLVLPDNHDILKSEIAAALKNNELVIVSGGLGPTLDDITRKVAAELLHSDFYLNQEIADELEKRYAHMPLSVKAGLRDQATIPTKAKPLKNSVGTAPGLIFESGGSLLILLPGVPPEMEAMMQDEVIPYLKKRYPQNVLKFQKMVHLFCTPESAVDPYLREFQRKDPGLDIGIYPSQGTLTVRISHLSSEALQEPYKVLINTFRANAFESAEGKIEEAIHELFISKGLKLVLAESCTGGNIAAKLTKIPGASEYFMGSIVAYSNALKKSLLGVSEADLQAYGAVSEQVAKEMARGVLKCVDADYSLAVTGIAGPLGGTEQKPVGTVYGAVCKKGQEPRAIQYFIPRNRPMIIERSTNLMLSELLIEVRKE